MARTMGEIVGAVDLALQQPASFLAWLREMDGARLFYASSADYCPLAIWLQELAPDAATVRVQRVFVQVQDPNGDVWELDLEGWALIARQRIDRSVDNAHQLVFARDVLALVEDLAA